MKWCPHNYQKEALAFLLSNDKAGLFLDPGLGKTSITLTTLKILKYSRLVKGVLIIAPLRVVYNVWPNEIEKWDLSLDLDFTILHGKNKEQNLNLTKDIYLINPEGLPWLHDTLLDRLSVDKTCNFDCLIIDESTKFKSRSTQRFKLLKHMLPLFKRRYILTGTPSPKNLLDLWSQVYIVDQGDSLDKSFFKFRKKFFIPEGFRNNDWVLKPDAENDIHNIVSKVILDMSAKDYLTLPELTINNIDVVLPKKAMKLYKKMEHEFFIELDKVKINAQAASQAKLKCHQITNGNVYEDEEVTLDETAKKQKRKVLHIHKAKIEALQELIEELNYKPLLVAYRFKHDLDAIKKPRKARVFLCWAI